MSFFISKDWEYSVLGILDWKKSNGLRFYMEFIRSNYAHLEGDIVEAGVFQGKSLLATALMLKELGSDKKVYGFDSFQGFPPIYHDNDDFSRFDDLRVSREITEDHFLDVKLNLDWNRQLSGSPVTPSSISGSGNFSKTSRELVEKKIEILGLDNVVLVDGPFDQTMPEAVSPEKIMCMLMDCDLYHSYVTAFEFVWPKLVQGGFVYLDEYYSLKFPGARIATNEFVASVDDASIKQFETPQGEFERWGLFKR